jgi:Bacterial SH3 domain/WD40-like Beta Propeller Repeat
MKRLVLVTFLLAVATGCGAQPTSTPTLVPPTPTETAVPPTETAVPPTATLVPTSVPPTPTPTEVPVTGTVTAALNVREAPSLSGKLLGVLKKGDDVTLTGLSQDKKWYQIEYPVGSSTTGWVLATLIQTAANVQALPTATEQVVAATPTIPKTEIAAGGTLTPTIEAGATLTVTIAAQPAATSTPQGTAVGAPGGSIIFDTFDNGEYQINQVNADGNGLKVLFKGASEPALSPDGTTLAYHKRKGAGPEGLWTARLDGSNATEVVNASNAGYPTWSPDGNNLAYNLWPNGPQANQVWRVTKEGSSPEVIGYGVRPAWQPGSSNIVIFDGCDGNGANCYSLFTENAYTPNLTNPKLIVSGTNASWAPNGARFAFQEKDANGINIYVASQDGSNKHAVTKDSGQNGDPIWSGDGRWIFYRSDKSGVWALYAIRADGTGGREIVVAPVNADNWNFEKLAIGP